MSAVLIAQALEALKSNAGKKLLGQELDFDGIQNRIQELASGNNINLDALEDATTQELQKAFDSSNTNDDSGLTREEKRNKRRERRRSRKSIREILEEKRNRLTDTKQRIIDQIQSLKAQLKSLIPVLETFTISGRVADRTTGEPLKGVKVSLGVNQDTAVEEIPAIPNVNNELVTSKVEVNPANFAYLPVPGSNTVRTDNQGKFTIDVRLPVIPKNQKTPLNFALIYTKSGFIPNTQIVLNGDRSVKSDLSVSSLVNIQVAAKKASDTFDEAIDFVQRSVALTSLNLFDLAIYARKKSLNKITTIIKTRLLPLCVGLLISFGITKLSQKNQKTCPTPDALNDVIRRRNRVTRQLNQIYTSIAVNSALGAVFASLAVTLRCVRLAMDQIPAPQAVGTFPAKDFGGLIFAQPYSFTAKLQHINDELEKLEEQNKGLNKAMLTNLIFLIAGAATVILLLKAIDDLAQECAQENGVELPELLAINQELLDLTDESKDDGNSVIENINGFILSVETDNKNPVGTLKRRFAVAKNEDGVTLLKGEPSFSSNDQILIDELVFYIQQNDLKAF